MGGGSAPGRLGASLIRPLHENSNKQNLTGRVGTNSYDSAFENALRNINEPTTSGHQQESNGQNAASLLLAMATPDQEVRDNLLAAPVDHFDDLAYDLDLGW